MDTQKAGRLALAALALVILVGARLPKAQAQDERTLDPEPSLAAIEWLEPVIIAREALHIYNEKNIVRFHPSGMVYICFKDNIDDHKTNKRSIKLFSYDGVKPVMVKNVSEDSQMAYEPDMVITPDGWIHISWAEALSGNANIQNIKYRYFDGSNWSPIITLRALNIIGTTGGWNPEKLDDVRLAVDDEHNVFVAFMMWPAARCSAVSMYNGKIYTDPFPMGGRSKHPSVAADDNFVHVTWQQLEGSDYTIRYARRKNAPGAPWSLLQKIVFSGGHRPFIRVDQNDVPHLVYMKDGENSTARDLHYRIWKGATFSGSWMVSDSNTNLYHTPAIAPLNANNVLIHSQTWQGGAINFFNWMRDGKWGGLGVINRIKAWSSFSECDLNPDGIGAVSYAAGDSIQLVLSGKLEVNLQPVAKIRTDKDAYVWGETIQLDASDSYDRDGKIVKYEWRIINDKVTLGGIVSNYKLAKAWGDISIRLTVTDDKGAHSTADKTVKVAALYSALDVVAKPEHITTLIYDRNGYVVTWKANPKNSQEGYDIVSYRIFSKVAGSSDNTYDHKETVSADRFMFFDFQVEEGKDYVYAVVAVDAAGHQSPYVNTGN